jgi:hypothetical protein
MNNDDPTWERLADAIDAKFGLTSHGKREEPLEDAPQLKRQVRYICFEREGVEYKFERVTSPTVLERKTHYHKAARGGVRFENIYDPHEVSRKTHLYRQRGGDWEAIDPEEFNL